MNIQDHHAFMVIQEKLRASESKLYCAEAIIKRSIKRVQDNTAYAVCCNQPQGSECCGNPDPDWPLWAVQVMTDLGMLLNGAPQGDDHAGS